MENLYTQRKLPNDPLSMIMGILSIPFCCCCGILGLIFGIVGFITAGKDQKTYLADPEAYMESSYQNAKTAKIISIVGIALNVIGLIAGVIQLIMGETSFMEEIMRDF